MSDLVSNFAKTDVVGTYDANDTAIVVESAEDFPIAPFNLTWWNATDYSDAADDPNREIVRVTSVDVQVVGSEIVTTFNVTRAQEGTTASTKNEANKSYKVGAGVTAKLWNDLAGGGDEPGVPCRIIFGASNPEGVTTANTKTLFWNTAGNTMWIKETGTSNTGWVAL